MTAPWDPMPSREWDTARTKLTETGLPWPEEFMRHDLRWWASKVRLGYATRIPGARTLATDWNVSRKVAARVMRDESGWMDPRFPKDEGTTTGPLGATDGPTKGPPEPRQDEIVAEGGPTTGPKRAIGGPPKGHTRVDTHHTTPHHKNNTPSTTGKPAAGTPTLSTLKWAKGAPKHIKANDLATTCLRVAAAITGRPCEAMDIEGTGKDITPKSAKTVTGPILALLRALDWPDLQQFEAEALLLARAARECPAPIFARDIRGEGWDGGRDRRHSVSTLMVQARWDERMQAAWAWKSGGAQSTTAATPPSGAPTGRQVWDLVCQWFNAGEIAHRARSGTLGKTPEEHARRKACIQRVGSRNIKNRDRFTENRLRDEFIAAYNGGVA